MTWRSGSAYGPLWDWDPFRALDRLQAEFGSVFEPVSDARASSFPAMDVWASEHDLAVTADVPGVDADKIEISVVGDSLKLSGTRAEDPSSDAEPWLRRERGFGRFERTIRLPWRVDADAVSADLKNGVLTVRLPKADADRARRVQVQIH